MKYWIFVLTLVVAPADAQDTKNIDSPGHANFGILEASDDILSENIESGYLPKDLSEFRTGNRIRTNSPPGVLESDSDIAKKIERHVVLRF